MIKIKGKINNLSVSILIDSWATFNCVNTNLVERCKIVDNKLHKHKLVQLDTWIKMKVTTVVEYCKFTMNRLQSKFNVDIIPLGSYDNFLGMDWLESHHVILDCHNKVVTCLDEDGNYVQSKGTPRLITVREILSIQLNKYICKGFQQYINHSE